MLRCGQHIDTAVLGEPCDVQQILEAFDDVHIVTEKTPDTYRRLARHHAVAPAQMLMVGNSLPSDVLPALEAGLHAAHVPYHLLWAYEHHELEEDHDVPTITSLHELPDLVAALKRTT